MVSLGNHLQYVSYSNWLLPGSLFSIKKGVYLLPSVTGDMITRRIGKNMSSDNLVCPTLCLVSLHPLGAVVCGLRGLQAIFLNWDERIIGSKLCYLRVLKPSSMVGQPIT